MPKPTSEPQVTVTKNGPYHVTGSIPLARQTIVAGADGNPEKYQEGDAFPAQESYWLCRCGHSAHKPFCDGTHKKVGFDGTETASREPYRQQAKMLEGPGAQPGRCGGVVRRDGLLHSERHGLETARPHR